MALHCLKPPVIIMGMARSGTTLLADSLFRLGLFIGHKRIIVDQEAKYFVAVNDTLLKRVHGYWDNPQPMRAFLKQEQSVSATARCMEEDIRSARVAGFLGWKRYLAYRSLEKFDRPWGWKDPRNVFTLPLWLRVFPEAKIVYIVRNGAAVASSLLTLERKVIARREFRRARSTRRLGWRSSLEHSGFKGAVRCLELNGGFSLWEEYVEQAENILSTIQNGRKILRYEDLLAHPAEYLRDLVEFCELSTSAERIRDAADRIDGSRSGAFLSEPRLQSFYREVSSSRWMKQYGYDNFV